MGGGSSFPRSLSLRSVSPHKKIFAMTKMRRFFSIIHLKEQNFSDLLWQDLAILVRPKSLV